MKTIKLFLRIALSAAFFSAVADRLGFWPAEVSAWGNWGAFVEYTATLNPWSPDFLIPTLAFIATAAEALLAITLLIGFKTKWSALLSGYLLLIFALSMTFTLGIKPVFDFSVFSAAAAAFALSLINEKFLEVDSLIEKEPNLSV